MRDETGEVIAMGSTLDLWSFRAYGERYFMFKEPPEPSLIPVAWTQIPRITSATLKWDSLEHITAEGLVSMAMVLAAIGSNRIRLTGLDETLGASVENPAGVRELSVRGAFFEAVPGIHVLSPYRIRLDSAEDCEIHARIYAEFLLSLSTKGKGNDSLRESIELTLLEVFTNALEHGGQGYALLSAAIGRADKWGVGQMVDGEREWFRDNKTTRILEIAVADVGPGVPAHLERNYVAAVAPLIRQYSSRGRRDAMYREPWAAHTAICKWAFAHHSTSKADLLLDTDTLNWRGLHRALAYASWHDGFIAISSGYARTGYATFANMNRAFEAPAVARAPLPGTIVTLRHVLRVGETRRQPVSRVDSRKQGEQSIDRSSSVSHPESKRTSEETLTTPVLHAFEEGWLHGDRRSRDLDHLRQHEPGVVPIHYFTDATPDRLAGLTAESSAITWSRALGSPRIVGAWSPTLGVMWSVAGVVPKDSLKWFSILTRDGVNVVDSDAAVRSTIEELARQYPAHVRITSDRVSLYDPAPPSPDDISKYASAALLQYPDLNTAIYKAADSECVLLTDNTRVRRYLSLTALVERSEIVTGTLAFLLASEIDYLRSQYRSFSVITSTLASYYLARRLLRVAGRSDVDVHFLGSRAARSGNSVLFQTATRTGRSLRDAARRAGGGAVAAIVGIDLGGGQEIDSPNDLPVRRLLIQHFDPQEITASTSSSSALASRVICTVSDWPVRAEPAPSLTVSAHADRINLATPELFSAGLQVINARVHSIALPGSALVARQTEMVIHWFADRIDSELRRIDSKHVIVICRRESPIFGLLPRVADALYARNGSDLTVERVLLPSVQFGGHSAIFANLGDAPRREDLRAQTRLVPSDVSDNYCVIYVDTAAVTGKNIRAAAGMLSALPPTPATFRVLVLTDRLSPRDSRFIGSIHLQNPHQTGAVIEVGFEYLFRLQVGSHEHLDATPAARLIRELDASDVRDHELTRGYVGTLAERVKELAHAMAVGAQRSRAFGHLYTPNEEVELQLSRNAILYRHTLALFHQNEPVMTTLGTLFLHLIESYDTGLLSILAIEPNLLRQPPLLLDCWADVRALANKCLHDPAAAIPVISDALAVATLETTTAVTEFSALAAAVRMHPALLPQLLTFLARLVRIDEHSGEQLLRAIDELPDETRHLENVLTPFVKARMHAYWPSALRLDGDSIGTIYDFAKGMFPHSAAYDAWRDADLFFTVDSPPRAIELDIVTAPAIALARNAIIPALVATRNIARERDDLTVVAELDAARVIAFEALEHLDRLIAKNTAVSDEIMPAARKAWLQLREKLVVTDPHVFLGSIPRSAAAEGMLERAMKRYFSMPERLIARYVSRQDDVTESIEGPVLPEGFRPVEAAIGGSWITTVPHQATLEIARVAIDNHRTHGRPGSLRIGRRAVETARGTELRIVFSDLAGPRKPSSGLGLALVQKICSRWGMPEPKSDTTTDGVFSLTLRFLRCAYVSWDEERSHEILHY